MGFSVANHQDLPDKIHKDCHQCPRLYRCDEVAMVRGELPTFAILPPPTNWLKIHA
jgi:amino-acid N-acetyltransferase